MDMVWNVILVHNIDIYKDIILYKSFYEFL